MADEELKKRLKKWGNPEPPIPPWQKGHREEQPYMFNPEVDAVPMPRGRPETGEPIGPAFPKPTRKNTREAADQALRDLMAFRGSVMGGVRPEKGEAEMMGPFGPMVMDLVRALTQGRDEVAEKVTPAVIVPKAGKHLYGPGAFTANELAAQKSVHKMHPKLLEAMRKDVRPFSDYTLEFNPKMLDRGRTTIRTNADWLRRGVKQAQIGMELNPRLQGFETPLHEADHLFAYRRGAQQGQVTGNQPNKSILSRAPLERQADLLDLTGGNVEHAATWLRAEEAARRLLGDFSPPPSGGFGVR